MRRSPASPLIAIMIVLLAGCSSAPSATTEGECHSDVVYGEMPEWARTGFRDGARVNHVLGRNQGIVAVYFTDSLVANAGPSPRNKVLLVARKPLEGPTPLSINARRAGSDEIVHRERGPGPGSLDMPTAGCWHVTLTWADQTDTIDLQYEDAG